MTEQALGRLYPICLHPYDPRWPEWYAEEAAALATLLGPLALRLEHFGSTAVPGLEAKPTIDVLVELVDASAETASRVHERLVARGYRRMWEQTDHLMFVWGYGPQGLLERSFHLHGWPAGAPALQERRLFRDHLRRHPEAAAAYATLKRELAARFSQLREHYTRGKAEFVAQLLEQARREVER